MVLKLIYKMKSELNNHWRWRQNGQRGGHRWAMTAATLLLLSYCLGCQTLDKDARTIDQRFSTFLANEYEAELAFHPEEQTTLGRKTNYDQWENLSDEFALAQQERAKTTLIELKKFPFKRLNAENQLSYRLFEKRIGDYLKGYEFRHHSYPVNQMFGIQADIPSLLINHHIIDNLDDARAYIGRVRNSKIKLEQLSVLLRTNQARKIILPKHLFQWVISDVENLLKGTPIQAKGPDHPLFEDFRGKIKSLGFGKAQIQELEADLVAALKGPFVDGYRQLLQTLRDLEPQAPTTIAASELPDGARYYAYVLERHTTTKMTPDEIHSLGIEQVARIQSEMKEILRTLKWQGDLRGFFAHMKKGQKFFYPQTKKGKEQYLKDTRKIIANMKQRLPELFGTLPQAELTVKAVEPYREKSAGQAFYSTPSDDGKRPGIYFVNLYDLRQAPKYEMEALAYHEAVPGHHMQLAIATELKDLPAFRRRMRATAFTEGWALYAEAIPKELGFYQDPLSDFGRLSMDLWRATRLVTDTGIHAKGWSREKAIAYLNENTPSDEAANAKAIDRYIVMPGQATAYTIGKLKILDLRQKAKAILKEQFDLREFHDQILKNGTLPLSVLGESIDSWLQVKSRTAKPL